MRSKSTTETNFLTYDNILLKTYYQVASTGDYRLLRIKGKRNIQEEFEAWERIVKRNSELTGRFEFNSYIASYKQFNMLLALYNTVKACLIKSLFVVDDDVIKFLRLKGYRIDTSGKTKYAESLEAAMRKANNLTTKIKMKRNELLALSLGEKKLDDHHGLEDVLANISAALGFNVPDDITLARFNTFCKIIKQKREVEKGKKK